MSIGCSVQFVRLRSPTKLEYVLVLYMLPKGPVNKATSCRFTCPSYMSDIAGGRVADCPAYVDSNMAAAFCRNASYTHADTGGGWISRPCMHIAM